MLKIDWRTPTAYAHAKELPAAGFAWEYLRRDEDYRREFLAITAKDMPDPGQLDEFIMRWGVRFSSRS